MTFLRMTGIETEDGTRYLPRDRTFLFQLQALTEKDATKAKKEKGDAKKGKEDEDNKGKDKEKEKEIPGDESFDSIPLFYRRGMHSEIPVVSKNLNSIFEVRGLPKGIDIGFREGKEEKEEKEWLISAISHVNQLYIIPSQVVTFPNNESSKI